MDRLIVCGWDDGAEALLEALRVHADLRPEACCVHERREPLTQSDWFFIVEDRHDLPISPHCRRTSNQTVTRPLTRLFKVVARE